MSALLPQARLISAHPVPIFQAIFTQPPGFPINRPQPSIITHVRERSTFSHVCSDITPGARSSPGHPQALAELPVKLVMPHHPPPHHRLEVRKVRHTENQ